MKGKTIVVEKKSHEKLVTWREVYTPLSPVITLELPIPTGPQQISKPGLQTVKVINSTDVVGLHGYVTRYINVERVGEPIMQDYWITEE